MVGLFAPLCPTVANFLLFELAHQLPSPWPDLAGASSFLVGSWTSVAMAYDLVHPERDPGHVNNSESRRLDSMLNRRGIAWTW